MSTRSGSQPGPSEPSPSDRGDVAWLWRCVQSEWAEDGWSRLQHVLQDQNDLVGRATTVVLLVISMVTVAAALAPLPAVGRVIVGLPAVVFVFVATGWALLPWLVSTDRRRALLPVGVLVIGVAVVFAGSWWVFAGGAVMAAAAGLGVGELRLTGRDMRIEQLRS